MSFESVKEYFSKINRDKDIIVLEGSIATVELAAKALNITEGEIAKTLGFRANNEYFLIVSDGSAKIDNRKYKEHFKVKARMMNADEVFEQTGHQVGGVCPFGLANKLSIYLDESLRKHEYVYPAAGSSNSAIRLSLAELETYTKGIWIDVTK